MFQRILAWIREVFQKMIGQNSIKQNLGVDVAISAPMAEALTLWAQMYQNQSPWLTKDIHSLNLAAAIAGEVARAATIEMQVTLTGSARATYLQQQVDRLLPRLRRAVESGCALGGMMLKPYIQGDSIAVDFVRADQFYPVAFDGNGNISACIFADQRQVRDKFYTRLEYHNMTPAGYTIRNMFFKSDSASTLGQPAEAGDVAAWVGLQEQAVISGVTRPLFGYFRYPAANNVDPASPLGVSCYARAADLVQQADRQWSDLLWEFESGQRALYADVIAFTKDKDGNVILPNRRLYRALNGSGNIGDAADGLFHDWSPSMREQNYLNGLDAILRKIEFTCGLAYGTLSNPATVDKTATELKISNQRSYSTITDTQKALRYALEDLLYAMDVWATLGNLAPRGSYKAVYDFDDSIIVDKDTQFQQDMRLVTAGLMSKVEFRVRNFGEDEATAAAKIAQANADRPQLDIIGG